MGKARGLIAALSLAAALLMVASPSHAQTDWQRCIDALRQDLPSNPQVRAETFDAQTRKAQDLRPPIDNATRTQPEFQLPIWDYLARLVDDKRVRDGAQVLQREAPALAAIAARHRVDAATLVAILGVESDFGRLPGRYPVVDATLSRACLALGNKERKLHFFTALWLLQEGLVQADEFRGSWAGAFGMTQFMPGTHARYMTDGDGDGRVDTARSMADALATAARYLSGLGWVDGLPWGVEVTAPKDVARRSSSAEREHACLGAPEAGGRCKRLDQWAALGIRLADGRPLGDLPARAGAASPSDPWALLTPAGANGPAWLVSRNFHVVWQYNRADAYALAIGLLSSALRNDPPQQAAWPTEEAQLTLSRTGLMALQQLLLDGGQCGMGVDGFDGPQTRQAVRDEERRRGLPETGRPTTTLLDLMRASPAPKVDCAAAPPPDPVVSLPVL